MLYSLKLLDQTLRVAVASLLGFCRLRSVISQGILDECRVCYRLLAFTSRDHHDVLSVRAVVLGIAVYRHRTARPGNVHLFGVSTRTHEDTLFVGRRR